jgi:hypothetical protein
MWDLVLQTILSLVVWDMFGMIAYLAQRAGITVAEESIEKVPKRFLINILSKK